MSADFDLKIIQKYQRPVKIKCCFNTEKSFSKSTPFKAKTLHRVDTFVSFCAENNIMSILI